MQADCDGAQFAFPDASVDPLPPFSRSDLPLDSASRAVATLVFEILDALAQPAWVLSHTGRVLHANVRAQVVPLAPLAGPSVRRVRLVWGRLEGWVVVLDTSSIAGAPSLAIDDGLPPRLAAVARLLAVGCSDKDIAERLSLTHATARTYVTRVYRRLDIHRRAELLLRVAQSPK